MKTWVLRCQIYPPAKFATPIDFFLKPSVWSCVGFGVGLDITEKWKVSAFTENHSPVAQPSHYGDWATYLYIYDTRVCNRRVGIVIFTRNYVLPYPDKREVIFSKSEEKKKRKEKKRKGKRKGKKKRK
jgi:hypothetical protein